jgi:hypothetical protein
VLVFSARLYASPDDDAIACPLGHALAPPITTLSERYLIGMEFRIQAAFKTLSVLHKMFNNNKNDPAAAAEVKPDLDATRSHLHEQLESRLDAYMPEASRARLDLPDYGTRNVQPPSVRPRGTYPTGRTAMTRTRATMLAL